LFRYVLAYFSLWVSQGLWYSPYPHRPLLLGITGALVLPIPTKTAASGYHKGSGTPHTRQGRCLWVSQGLWYSPYPPRPLLLGITGALALPIPTNAVTSGYHGNFTTPHTRQGRYFWVSQGLWHSTYPPRPLLLGITGSFALSIPAKTAASGYHRLFGTPHTHQGRCLWVSQGLHHSPYPPRPPPLGIIGSLALPIPARAAASGYHGDFTTPHTHQGRCFRVSQGLWYSPYPPRPLLLGITRALALSIPAKAAASGYHGDFTTPHTHQGRCFRVSSSLISSYTH